MTVEGMSVHQVFNGWMKAFVDNLAACFPEDARLVAAAQTFDDMVALDEKKPMHLFAEKVAPHVDLVTRRDPSLFDKLQLLGGIDMKALWAAPDLSDNSRQVIWQYLSNLCLAAMLVRNMPEDVLSELETFGKGLEEKIQSGQFDPSNLESFLGQNMQGIGALATSLLGTEGMAALSKALEYDSFGTH